MKRITLASSLILFSLTIFGQEKEMKYNQWSPWKTDTVLTSEGTINVYNKRTKVASGNQCLITEEIILFHDKCNNLTRKIKLRSDCKHHMGEGDIISEKNYKSNCDRK
jgi:hypothetical protein